MPCGAGAGSGGGAATGGGGGALLQVGVGGVLRQVGVGGGCCDRWGRGERCEALHRHYTSSCNIIVKYSFYSIITIHEIICVCMY